MIHHYLKYWFFKRKATTQHGVHSPYLYSLVCSCFYNSKFNKIRVTPWNSSAQDIMATYFLEQLMLFNQQIGAEFKIEKDKIIYQKDKSLKQNISEIKERKEPQITMLGDLHNQRKTWESFASTSKHIILDLYFFGIVIQRPQQGAELIFLKVF